MENEIENCKKPKIHSRISNNLERKLSIPLYNLMIKLEVTYMVKS